MERTLSIGHNISILQACIFKTMLSILFELYQTRSGYIYRDIKTPRRKLKNSTFHKIQGALIADKTLTQCLIYRVSGEIKVVEIYAN